jgi:hypothetical protein
MAPPGCKVVVHERPQKRGTWADHGVAGFYIGPAMHHFQNYYCYIPTTRGERVSNTIEFFPTHVDMPDTSSEDRLTQITQDLITVLQKPHPKTPFLDQGDKTSDAIASLRCHLPTSAGQVGGSFAGIAGTRGDGQSNATASGAAKRRWASWTGFGRGGGTAAGRGLLAGALAGGSRGGGGGGSDGSSSCVTLGPG